MSPYCTYRNSTCRLGDIRASGVLVLDCGEVDVDLLDCRGRDTSTQIDPAETRVHALGHRSRCRQVQLSFNSSDT